MKDAERLRKFIELQDKNLKFEDIASQLGIATSTLRVFLNKRGYKINNGKYRLKDEVGKFKQMEFEDSKRLEAKKYVKTNKSKSVNTKVKKIKSKKKIKVNITQEDLDKLCEVYDWYMQVKDLKSMKLSKNKNQKDINIENANIDTLKKISIKVDKSTWDDFERLCSNSQFKKQEIITQALKNFMKEYKNLL